MAGKITDMTATSSVSATDLFETTVDPSGSPLTRKATAAQVATYVDGTLSRSAYPPIIVANYYRGYGQTASNSATSGSCAQLTALYPIFVDRALTLDRLAVSVTTLEAGSTARLGIYSLTNGSPVNRVADFGTVDCSSTGIKTASGSQAVGPGWYALAVWVSNHATVRFKTNGFGLNAFLGDDFSAGSNANCMWTVTATDYSAGLPSTISAILNNSSVSRPAVSARFA